MQTAAKSKLFQPALVTIADYALYVHTSQQSSKEQTSRAFAVQWHAAQPIWWSPPTEFGIQEDPSRSSMHMWSHTHTCIVPHIHTSYEYKNQACIEDHGIECPQKSPQQRKIKVYFTANTSTAAADVSYSREPFIQTQQQQSQNMATWCFQSWFIEGALAFSFICLVLMLLLVVSSQIITGYSTYVTKFNKGWS